jgi:hypothetical protein
VPIQEKDNYVQGDRQMGGKEESGRYLSIGLSDREEKAHQLKNETNVLRKN